MKREAVVTLFPPVEPMLAQAVEVIPPVRPHVPVAYEQKFDGHRMLVFTPSGPGGRVLLQTSRGVLVQDAFPDLVAAAGQLPHGLVLDGEVVVQDRETGGLSFEALQLRAAARAPTAPALAARLPALFVAFDVLQFDGTTELLALPYRERRRRLEALFAARGLTAPWTLCPMTTDVTVAREWLQPSRDAPGLEGVVVKNMAQPYQPSVHGWTKIRRRDTTEGIIGAVTGTLTHPQLLVLGRHDEAGRLHAIGRTVPLRPDISLSVGEHLAPAGGGHPWEGVAFASAWGSRGVTDAILVRPDLVAEASADTSIDRGGVFRHPMRFQRLRTDVTVNEVPGFGEGRAASAG